MSGAQAEHVVDVTSGSFAEVVIEGSRRRPVVVDFWAPWCGPCRALGPVLEKLAAEFGGRFLLAKVNSDEEPDLSARFGVRGIPDVKAFVDGRVVDEFSGALPEGRVRVFLEGVAPSLAEPLRLEAAAMREAGDLAGALARLQEALGVDATHEATLLDRADLLIEMKRVTEAQAIVDGIGDRARNAARVTRLQARLAFAAGGGDAEALARRVAGDPGDLAARLELANALAGAGDHATALDHALEVVRRDRAFGDDAGRRTMLRIFELLGPDSDLARRYRRELAAAINR
jgi:putative thioredoxin